MSAAPRSSRGFTLIELLLAVVITAGLAAAVLAVTTSTLRLWQRTQDRFSTQTQATLALNLLERDLQAALFRGDGRTWLAVDVINSPDALLNHGWQLGGLMKPAGGPLESGAGDTIGGARFGLSGAWLRFMTTNLDADAGALPAAVSYQVVRRPVSGSVGAGNPAAVRYALARSAVSAEKTWSSGFNLEAPAYVSTSAGFPPMQTPASVMNPSSADALASNVVDFGVWLYGRESSGKLRRIFPATPTDTSHHARQQNEFPVAADVMLRVLTDEGAQLLAAIESRRGAVSRPSEIPDDAAWWWSVVEMHSHVYVRRIRIVMEVP
ncbi:PulJ/GspJ family protein [Opitutus terrae]|uniref:Prepilin-type N-terminal cleavage/methylation domain-containing protein n=1 Tax=Opitutus terrae (strain DSM 11246 / JCM 15787 / PB90-1) TaxID=452637 RepID=B1ZYB0_OPITP|nr:prepilin-type N-terminal cleavage/methylation domain-containing protein [Opitutus terrae]ACB77008.1 hypothetical protein Oter_3733 [Opitutus terrae PB90-1]